MFRNDNELDQSRIVVTHNKKQHVCLPVEYLVKKYSWMLIDTHKYLNKKDIL